MFYQLVQPCHTCCACRTFARSFPSGGSSTMTTFSAARRSCWSTSTGARATRQPRLLALLCPALKRPSHLMCAPARLEQLPSSICSPPANLCSVHTSPSGIVAWQLGAVQLQSHGTSRLASHIAAAAGRLMSARAGLVCSKRFLREQLPWQPGCIQTPVLGYAVASASMSKRRRQAVGTNALQVVSLQRGSI